MADLPDLNSKLTDVEIQRDAPLTTNLHERYGGNLNRLLDVAADQRTRIDNQSNFQFARDIPAANFQYWYNINNTVGVFVVNENFITPPTSTVFVFLTGTLIQFSDEQNIEIRVLRNGSTIRSIVVTEQIAPQFWTDEIPGAPFNPPQAGSFLLTEFSLSHLNFIDTGANTNVSNTYQVICETTPESRSANLTNVGVQLIGRT